MNDWVVPDWPAPASVGALSTTRSGGVSQGPWQSLNLGTNSGDDSEAVAQNRALLRQSLPAEPLWLRQVHGTAVTQNRGGHDTSRQPPEADAQWSDTRGAVCVVLTADCLPVLFCDRQGTQVAAAHAGWRGLAAGVLENTVAAMRASPGDLLAWLGPAIGPAVYQVGNEVREAFLQAEPATSADQAAGQTAADAFRKDGERWLFDLYAMVRHRLQRAGVGHISGGGFCTFTDSKRFFSYRRDRITGRMASLVWLRQE